MLATDTNVSSFAKSDFVNVDIVSGSIPLILTKLFAPWCAWFGWITSMMLPVLISLVGTESAPTVIAALLLSTRAVLVSLFAP